MSSAHKNALKSKMVAKSHDVSARLQRFCSSKCFVDLRSVGSTGRSGG